MGFGRTIDTSLHSEKVLKLQESFASRIVGQRDATSALTRVLEGYLGGFGDERRPIGSLLFVGPTGTGKTRTVEAFCEGLFGFQDAMVKIDCAEFQYGHEIAKLVGSPPGYLGHRETPARLKQGALDQFQTVAMPVNIVLFDEIEKAGDELWHLLLGILDKGLLTLGDNTVTNFTKSIIVMTSNVGAAQMAIAAGENQLGFQTEEIKVDDQKLENIALSAARKKFTPEFLNRLDEIVMFKTLTKPQIKQVLDMELSRLQQKLFIKQTTRLMPSPAAKNEIIVRGFDAKYNARNLRRVIERDVMTPIARAISTKQLKTGEDIVVDIKDKQFVFFALDTDSWPLLKL